MSPKLSLTQIQAIWNVVGPLVGVFIGAYLTTHIQRKQWLLDNKKQEYRELLSTLTRCFNEISEAHMPMVAFSPEDHRRHTAAVKESLAVIRDRIFIARDLEVMKLEDRWTLGLLGLNSVDRDASEFSALFGTLRAEILNAAERALRKR